MDSRRIARTRKTMAAEKIDALILRLPESITMLGGYYPLTGLNFLLFPGKGEPVILAPASEKDEAAEGWWNNIVTFEFGILTAGNPNEAIERLLKGIVIKQGKSWKRIGYEGSFESLAPALLSGEGFYPAAPTQQMLSRVFGDEKLIDCTHLLYQERAIKTGNEIAKLQIANKVAEIGLAKFKEAVIPGRTEAEIAGLVTAAIMKDGIGTCGAQRIQVFPQVSSGPEHSVKAWRPCEITTNRIIRDGDLVVLELAVVADGFWADNTRTRVAGKISAKQREVFEVVRKAQEAARNRVSPGVKCSDVDQAARTIIEKAGLGEYFIHITGHGIGFRYHEPIPIIEPENTNSLKVGMVFSVEPGVYIPEFGGIRIEDNVAVTQEGALTLTTFNRNLEGAL